MLSSCSSFQIMREVELHRSLRHPHVVEFHSFFEDDHFIYFILEYCCRKVCLSVFTSLRLLNQIVISCTIFWVETRNVCFVVPIRVTYFFLADLKPLVVHHKRTTELKIAILMSDLLGTRSSPQWWPRPLDDPTWCAQSVVSDLQPLGLVTWRSGMAHSIARPRVHISFILTHMVHLLQFLSNLPGSKKSVRPSHRIR